MSKIQESSREIFSLDFAKASARRSEAMPPTFFRVKLIASAFTADASETEGSHVCRSAKCLFGLAEQKKV